MITIIINTIIDQIDRLFTNCFTLLFVDKNAGKTKTSTAIKKITDIIWLVSI